MPQFVTDSAIRQRLASLLKTDAGKVPAYWDIIISDSNLAAYQEIVGRLAERGYDAGQIASWDRGSEFEIDIGLFWSLVKGAGLHAYDDKFIKNLDRRAEIDDVIVLAAGVIILPNNSAQGTKIGWGQVSTVNERFSQDFTNENNDPNFGQPTDW